MQLKVGVCGTGAFARHFIPLFKAHPEVGEVILCDLDKEKLRTRQEEFAIAKGCPSLDELCQTDVDAVAIFTQPHLHGPQAVQALRSGKHVYSAVPSAVTTDEIRTLVRAVEDTGRVYMIGETSVYYPNALYCRNRYRQGDFGRIVYGEGEYYHDWDHGLYEAYKWRHGAEWEQYAGKPPLFYPTHSTSMIVSVTGAHVTHVCGMGFTDDNADGLYARPDNRWKNPFSNETMLCRMSDGSMARINEFRRIGHPGTVGLSLYGTEASFEEQSLPSDTALKPGDKRCNWSSKDRKACLDLTEALACIGVADSSTAGEMAAVTGADGTHQGVSKIHPVHLLPKTYLGLGNGHRGSHQFLIHDFVTACVSGEAPALTNVWQAARYLLPGLVAHESAMTGSPLMEVPDYGDGTGAGGAPA
jgi:predicted dehydrogenase